MLTTEELESISEDDKRYILDIYTATALADGKIDDGELQFLGEFLSLINISVPDFLIYARNCIPEDFDTFFNRDDNIELPLPWAEKITRIFDRGVDGLHKGTADGDALLYLIDRMLLLTVYASDGIVTELEGTFLNKLDHIYWHKKGLFDRETK